MFSASRQIISSSFRTLRSFSCSGSRLVLQDGTVFHGRNMVGSGLNTSIQGEVVFNTGMTGYTETLSDPSYSGQILVLTYPMIGNYGVPSQTAKDQYGLPLYMESWSAKPRVSGLVVSELCSHYSHHLAAQSLPQWMRTIPILEGVDTRALTKHIRECGAMPGALVNGDMELDHVLSAGMGEHYVARESISAPKTFGNGHVHIVAVDCGMKMSILKNLLDRNAKVTVVPWNYDFAKMFQEQPFDGLFLSNGPGDPKQCMETVKNLQNFLQMESTVNTPVFGICLGHQLLALANGGNTYKLPFGHRSQNQPVQDLITSKCYVTSQNHGYAVDSKGMDSDIWADLFVNVNDGTNEGLFHKFKPVFSAQFHPEAKAGPTDTEYLFDRFLSMVRKESSHLLPESAVPHIPIGKHLANGGKLGKHYQTSSIAQEHVQPIRKVLMLGSGGLQIGQAGEFDYSGSQALKALREEGIETILINPNIATVQTSTSDQALADKLYFAPVTADAVQQILRKELPDGLLLQFGGQTALNTGVELYRSGILQELGIKVLGTPVETIIATEDREIFAEKLGEIGETLAPSVAAETVEEAVAAAEGIGYPVIVRSAFSLGGLGSGFAHSAPELRALVRRALASSPQVLVEKSLRGWKEVEYEVVRDSFDDCIAVCNMENFDPLGVHTGDSIVVAPSQTLDDSDYQRLRDASLRLVRHVGVIGECNVQFALDPLSKEYVIIEMNPRLSRSSALASKATGYPLAAVAAKLALGKRLCEVDNGVTGKTKAMFEPALDYCIVKIPKWDLGKFPEVSSELGSGMKSVGEAMAIGRGFEETLQKALRMVTDDFGGFKCSSGWSARDIEKELTAPTDKRIYAVCAALEQGWGIDKIHEISRIDRWFLGKLENIVRMNVKLQSVTSVTDMDQSLFDEAKRLGFSDFQIAQGISHNSSPVSVDSVRARRLKLGVVPSVKQIDTLAAEFPAKTNYLYTSYHGQEDDVGVEEGAEDKGICVLGSGSYRIGSSVEFDFSAVRCVQTLAGLGRKTAMINYNPETVSTDYDESDYLFFEELSLERVCDIQDRFGFEGLVVSVGGQASNNLAVPLAQAGVPILGTQAVDIDKAEDRTKFSALIDSVGLSQPPWASLTGQQDVSDFARQEGYPILVRPSYVLSGAGMKVIRSEQHLNQYFDSLDTDSKNFVVSKFYDEYLELDLDAVASNGQLVGHALSEHVERAGVHSGDATLVLPAPSFQGNSHAQLLIQQIAERLASSLSISGPFNAQILCPPGGPQSINDLMVIECNVRASRSLPFVSKAMGQDYAELATLSMLGAPMKDAIKSQRDFSQYAVKCAQFSFGRLLGSDPVLGVEMASTGEVATFGKTKNEAFLKSLLATGFVLPGRTGRILLSAGSVKNKESLKHTANQFKEMGFEIWATPGTAEYFREHGLDSSECFFDIGKGHPKAVSLLENRDFDLVINVPSNEENDLKDERSNCFLIRRAAIDHNVSLVNNLQIAQQIADSLNTVETMDLETYQEIFS